MLRRPTTVLSLTPEDIADFEDRHAGYSRSTEAETSRRPLPTARRTATATPTPFTTAGARNENVPFAGGRQMPSSPPQHSFSDGDEAALEEEEYEEEEEESDAEVDTSYYARAQAQAARVTSFGHLAATHHYYPAPEFTRAADHDEDDSLDEHPNDGMDIDNPHHYPAHIDLNPFAGYSTIDNAATPIPPRSSNTSTLPASQATTTIAETPTNTTNHARETRHSQPPPVHQRRTRDRTAEPPAHHHPAVTTTTASASTSLLAAQAATAPTRESRLRGHHHYQHAGTGTGGARAVSGASTTGGAARSTAAAAAVTPEARVQRSRDERIGVAAPRRGRGYPHGN